jgi:type IV pilus assembly protein PilM
MLAMKNWIGSLSSRVQGARIGPIGLELSREKLHLVQLERSEEGRITLRAHASVPLPYDREALMAAPRVMRKLLARAFAADHFKGRQTVLAMPPGHFKTLPLSYQLASGQSEESVIGALMAERVDGPLTDYVVDYLPVRTRAREGERLALVAVSPRAAVLQHLELARLAGLQVEALEIGPVAIRRLVSALSSGNDTEVVLVLNTGTAASYLTVVAGRRLLLDQELRFGESALLERIAASLELAVPRARELVMRTGLEPEARRNDADVAGARETLREILRPELARLVEEIERACLFVASETRGANVARVYLLGSLARWPGADRMLAELARVPIATMPNPLTLLGGEGRQVNADTMAPELAVATGLALRGLTDSV